MSVQYSDVPAGGLMSIPPAIPQGMLYRVKQIMGVSKQTFKFKIVPLSGQTTATNGQKIIVSLPPNSSSSDCDDITKRLKHESISSPTALQKYSKINLNEGKQDPQTR